MSLRSSFCLSICVFRCTIGLVKLPAWIPKVTLIHHYRCLHPGLFRSVFVLYQYVSQTFETVSKTVTCGRFPANPKRNPVIMMFMIGLERRLNSIYVALSKQSGLHD